MSVEDSTKTQGVEVVTEETRDYARRIFNPEKLSRSHIARFFHCSERHITDDEVLIVRARLAYLWYQHVAGVLRAGQEGSKRKLEKRTAWHDSMHAAFEFRRRHTLGIMDNSCTPRFVDSRERMNEDLFRDELRALLFPGDIGSDSNFVYQCDKKPPPSFESAWARYFDDAANQVFKIEQAFFQREHFSRMVNAVAAAPDEDTHAWALEIYEARTGADPIRRSRVLLDIFLKLTDGVPETSAHES
jgi:hypothetical protein